MKNHIQKITLTINIILSLMLTFSVSVAASEELSSARLIEQIIAVTKAQNKVLMHNSTLADAKHLFSLYSDDFIYVHEAYGGEYSKKHLYNNTVKYLKSGGYNKVEDRYSIVSYLAGLNTVAVQRKENSGVIHLAVFEFDGDKVSKITEYWQ